jgi:hypothetical protein
MSTLLAELRKEKEQFQAKAVEAVRKALKEFIVTHPTLKALGWVQYTPYFNDGEECVFSMHQMFVTDKLDAETDTDFYSVDDWYETNTSYYDAKTRKYIEGPNPKSSFTKQEWKEILDFCDDLQGMSEELKVVFGDHVRVIVTANGADVEEYEHD